MRTRWVQHPDTLELIPADQVTFEHERKANADSTLWNDRSYQDANDPRFASRTAHREYMRRNDLTTMDDFKGTWDRAAKERADFFTTGGDHRARREDVERTIYNLENAKRR